MKKRSITKEISELRAMTAHELADRYEELFGKAPRIKHKEWLWKKIAQKIQEQRFGGLPGAARRHLSDLLKDIELPCKGQSGADTGKPRASRAPDTPAVGTVLVRKWHGQEYRVKVTAEGFEYDGVVYRSVSAVALAITGTRWNGKLFFGIANRKKA